MGTETAMFGAGCFWHVQAAFDKIPGVVSTAVGYSGGDFENPKYEDVCSGRTGHAEVTQIEFDPSVVTYKDLLNAFWEIHDPTTLDRQGPDIGSQYRSAIFYNDQEQELQARMSLAEQEMSGRYRQPIVTEILAAGKFWRAEENHQHYFEKTGRSGCSV